MTRPGHHNALTDVPGVLVGHHGRAEDGWLSGTTVVVLPDGGALAAVDVRGGGPATRETAALAPGFGGARADAVVLTGGSAYGLAAADGVQVWLEERRGTPDEPWVPLVPTAALFDLGRGGEVTARPGPDFGRAAAEAASGGPVPQGTVGAGTGAVTAEMKGGVGTASAVLPGGAVVGALAVVNAHGSTVDPWNGLPHAAALGADGEFALRTPDTLEHTAARRALAEPGRPAAGLQLPNTVIGVVATDAPLDHVALCRAAEAGHRGMARAVHPVHGPSDGDTVFALGVGPVGPADPALLAAVTHAAERTFARAIVHAVLAATSVTTPFGHIASYRELYPQATAALAAP
ncbi:putative hydrolase [Pseudonocardia sp. Ae406_Ps2]|uniref:P1 family peptidase n=1 Tax=unclassified Pseudonocardia TaxID=2619320 RepID=UPI00094B3996|nr:MULTISPECIES: P1 family peptidase [unclassified Pseudonocardia]OLM01288.1 putative hydrolase [Pseudonocardia sp. Ae406_Ps2]OLM06915.1 putative hydrolase [Pseudonocardia sp. Ae331_Ps2]OLM22861.1 putative hydrolase [Pseudonocardia sp. Ae706_Ps2]